MKYKVKKKSSWVLFCFYAIGEFLFATPGVICKNSYVRRIATTFCVKIQCLLTGQRRSWRLRPILRYVLHIPKRNHIVARCSGPKCAINLFSKNDCNREKNFNLIYIGECYVLNVLLSYCILFLIQSL